MAKSKISNPGFFHASNDGKGFNINISENNSEVEVLQSNFSKVTLSKIKEGTDNEKSVFNISGRVKLNTTTKIGTISVNASQEGQVKIGGTSTVSVKHATSPNLVEIENNTNNRVFFKLNKTTRDDKGNFIGYLFDVMYDARDILNLDTLRYQINEDLAPKLTDRSSGSSVGLLNFEFGSNIISPLGEKRKFRLTGSEGTVVPIVITKIDDTKDANGTIISMRETSLLPSANHEIFKPAIPLSVSPAQQDTSAFFGKPVIPLSTSTQWILAGNPPEYFTVHYFTIPKKGVLDFYVNFPPQTSNTRYSMKLRLTEIQDRSRIYDGQGGVATNHDNGTWVKYSKGDSISLGIPDGWSNSYYAWLQQQLNQFMNPILTLKTVTTWSNATVNTGSGTFVTFDNSNPIVKTYTGKYNKKSSEINSKTIAKYFSVTHVFKASSGSFALRSGSDGSGGTLGAPVFSNESGNESDWTNSIPNDDLADGFVGNGGTDLDITGISVAISTTSSSNDTLTLKYSVDIEKWGTKDVTMQLDVDDIATLS